jgi:hypothetical protein
MHEIGMRTTHISPSQEPFLYQILLLPGPLTRCVPDMQMLASQLPTHTTHTHTHTHTCGITHSYVVLFRVLWR